MKPIHIGTSAFYNAYWQKIFYPEDLPKNLWFEFYCQHFDTYELNSTFYKFPTQKILQNWYNKVPDDFVFSVKAFKGITHFKRFNDCQQEIADFYTVCTESLKDKLGCILFQMPPGFHYSEEKLALIIENLNPTFSNVVEFRHQSWWNDTVFKALAENKITFCNVSYPNLPEDTVATTDIGYFRLHGNRKLFYSEYTPEELQQLYQTANTTKEFQKTFVYFNNTASAAGILNAMEMKKLLVEAIK